MAFLVSINAEKVAQAICVGDRVQEVGITWPFSF